MIGANYKQGINDWGLGYGIGRQLSTKFPKLNHNLELSAMHINSNKSFFTTKLNLLTQLKWNLDISIGKRASIFLGPSFNFMASRVFNPDTNTFGADLSPYTLFNFDNTKVNTGATPNMVTTNYRGWVGFNAGIRF